MKLSIGLIVAVLLALPAWAQQYENTPLNTQNTTCQQGSLEAGLYAQWTSGDCNTVGNTSGPGYQCDVAYFDHGQPAMNEFIRCDTRCCEFSWWYPDWTIYQKIGTPPGVGACSLAQPSAWTHRTLYD